MYLSSEFFTRNRQRLSDLLRQGAMAVFNSNDILPTNADGTFPFRQNNDLYYLTGIVQEQTILLVFPSHPDKGSREILFIVKPDPLHEKWNGHQYTLEEASALSGIANVKYVQEFEAVFHAMMFRAEYVYLNSIEHARADVQIRTRDDRFGEWCKSKYRLHRYERVAPFMMRLRMIKSEEEILMMKQAAAITGKGFERLLGFIRPGVKEKHIAAEMIHEYMMHETGWAGYDPIVASGKDSCILHYISNHKTCEDGTMVLIDAAASFGYYHADMTRTIPVNGRFSKRQKQVYQSVLDVHHAMRKLMKPGVFMKDLQQTCHSLIIEELVKLGLCDHASLKEKGRAYFLDQYAYHGFSHFLGLDVHDVGDFELPFEAGMVFTNEPGIYSAAYGFGVRIENNILITADGNEDLMQGVPIEVEEIEMRMNQQG